MRTLVLPIITSVFLFLSCDSTVSSSKKVLSFNPEEASVLTIREAMLKGEATSEEIVGYYLEKIERLDQSTGLNSIVIINPDALKVARQKDLMLRAGDSLPPLHGIPMIVKDNYNTVGLQTAAGSMAMKGYCPEFDAYIIKKLKEAGAIVLAKSNMAEWAFSPRVTISSIAGETKNPYNLEHVPAGSSGGTAAAIAANFGAIGLGTDTGNSIRGPSSHNSLVGFRTTLGLVSRAGIVPLYLRNDVGGPMTRTVEDATIVLNAIAGFDPDDPLTEISQNRIPEDYTDYLILDGLKNARIGILQDIINRGIDPQVDELFNQAIADLRGLGAEVVENIVIESFDELSRSHWASAFQYDINNYLAAQGETVPVKSLDEIISAGNYSNYIENNLIHHLENPENPEDLDPPSLGPYSDTRRVAFRESIENMMDELGLDAVIYPSWNYPPAKIDKPEDYRGDNSQIISPHTGQPAFTIPMGYTSGDLPCGLQFLGRCFDEPTLIKLTYSYEQGTKHRKPPTLFSN